MALIIYALAVITYGSDHLSLRALSFCQNWTARPISLQRKCNNLKEHLHDNPSHSSGGLYIILKECLFCSIFKIFQHMNSNQDVNPLAGQAPRTNFHSGKHCHSNRDSPGGVLDISLGGEVRRGSSYPDPV